MDDNHKGHWPARLLLAAVAVLVAHFVFDHDVFALFFDISWDEAKEFWGILMEEIGEERQ